MINQTAMTIEMDHPQLSDDKGTALESVLRMNPGDGPNSYAANSISQKNVMLKVRSILEESVKRVYTKISFPDHHFAVADLGCATGPNSLEAAAAIIEAITGLCSQTGKSTPEMLVFLNDLPGNDFNSIFLALPDFYDKLKLKNKEENEVLKAKLDTKCFVSAMPGSFFGRLFPSRSLHFVHSAMSLHWLSQVPNGLEHNKGNIYIPSTSFESSDSVWEAYLKQFQMDFTLFLCSRAQEIIPQGEMLLTFMCRTRPDARDKESVYYMELLAKCLVEMAAEGQVEEKDIDSFNMPVYMPYEEEVRDLVEKEGSFIINKLETIQHSTGPFNDDEEDIKLITAKMLSLGMRAAQEPLLTSHFGEGGLMMMGDLYQRVESKAVEYLSSEKPIVAAFLVLSVTKK